MRVRGSWQMSRNFTLPKNSSVLHLEVHSIDKKNLFIKQNIKTISRIAMAGWPEPCCNAAKRGSDPRPCESR